MNANTEHSQFKFSNWMLAVPLYLVLLLWIILWAELKFDLYFTKYGLYPRTSKGLQGVIFSPFIHSGVKHLFNNSVPLFVLLLSLFYFYRKIAFKILIYGTLLTGIFTWVIARPAYHIGASGVVYLLFSFLLFSGLIRRYYRLVAVSLIVIFLYGGMVWYILPIKEDMSWEGHLSGFITGLLLAIIYRKHGPQPVKYDWGEEDETEQYFIYEEEEPDAAL
ncbi:MAG: rhomboid family intramembrane serine protease [Flavobacteriales bacterium]|nr:MAG: rhomboid family intramembrane serine protease [Flavobacteriales bacterium]